MEITAVETIELHDMNISETMWVSDPTTPSPEDDGHYWAKQLLFVRLHTDEGAVGLGETYHSPEEDAATIHNNFAPVLFGEDPDDVERLWRAMYRNTGAPKPGGGGMRTLSAIDVALWDLKGQIHDAPVYDLLGGRTHDSLRTYNTCYEGEYSFVDEPVELAESLLAEGIEAMKIWPYDDLSFESGGHYVSPAVVEAGAEPLRLIKEELGTQMDVALELHGHWDLPSVKRIARHVEQYDPMWIEEVVEPGDLAAYESVARATSAPVLASEKLTGKYDFVNVFANVDLDIAMFDVEWVGGLTEAKKIAALAEAHHVSVAPHNCGGPVLHFANLHLGATVPNLMIMESVRGRYNGWHHDLVTQPATAKDGRLQIPNRLGLGTELKEAVVESEGAIRRVSER
jgi:L-alanine-DL-glutamate epimerase-like enolase superfamily enzyme